MIAEAPRAAALPEPKPLLSRLRHLLPQGHTLPEAAWQVRHRVLLGLLWAQALGLAIFALAEGYAAGHALLHAAAPAGLAGLALVMRHRRRARRRSWPSASSPALPSSCTSGEA